MPDAPATIDPAPIFGLVNQAFETDDERVITDAVHALVAALSIAIVRAAQPEAALDIVLGALQHNVRAFEVERVSVH